MLEIPYHSIERSASILAGAQEDVELEPVPSALDLHILNVWAHSDRANQNHINVRLLGAGRELGWIRMLRQDDNAQISGGPIGTAYVPPGIVIPAGTQPLAARIINNSGGAGLVVVQLIGVLRPPSFSLRQIGGPLL